MIITSWETGHRHDCITAAIRDQLRLVTVQIFNYAMAEMQADSTQRMFPMALLPWCDCALSFREIQRVQAMGLKGLNPVNGSRMRQGSCRAQLIKHSAAPR